MAFSPKATFTPFNNPDGSTSSNVNTVYQSGIQYNGKFRLFSLTVNVRELNFRMDNYLISALSDGTLSMTLEPSFEPYGGGFAGSFDLDTLTNPEQFGQSYLGISHCEVDGTAYIFVFVNAPVETPSMAPVTGGVTIGIFSMNPGTKEGEVIIDTLLYQSMENTVNFKMPPLTSLAVTNDKGKNSIEITFIAQPLFSSEPSIWTMEFDIDGATLSKPVALTLSPLNGGSWKRIFGSIVHDDVSVLHLTDDKDDVYYYNQEAGTVSLMDISKIVSPNKLPNPMVAVVPGMLCHKAQKAELANLFFVAPYLSQSVGEPPEYAQVAEGDYCPTFNGTSNFPIDSSSFDNNFNYTSIFTTTVYVDSPDTANSGSLIQISVFGVCRLPYDQFSPDQATATPLLFLFPSAQLIKSSPVSTDTSAILSAKQKLPFEQSWTLIGEVFGCPPYPPQTDASDKPTPSSVSIEFDSTSQKSYSSTYSLSFTVSDKGILSELTGSISIKNVLSHGKQKTTTYESSYGFKGANIQPNQGYLIFNAPTIENTAYQVYSPDGLTDLNRTYNVLEVTGIKTLLMQFDITKAGAPNTINEGLKTFPSLDDPEAWQTAQITDNSDNKMNPELITATTTVTGNSSLEESQQKQVTKSNTTTVTISEGIFGFSASQSGSWETQNTTTTTFSTNYGASLGPIVVGSNPAAEISEMGVQPEIHNLDNKTLNQQNLLPKLFKDAEPWIISWVVKSITPGVTDKEEGS